MAKSPEGLAPARTCARGEWNKWGTTGEPHSSQLAVPALSLRPGGCPAGWCAPRGRFLRMYRQQKMAVALQRPILPLQLCPCHQQRAGLSPGAGQGRAVTRPPGPRIPWPPSAPSPVQTSSPPPGTAGCRCNPPVSHGSRSCRRPGRCRTGWRHSAWAGRPGGLTDAGLPCYATTST